MCIRDSNNCTVGPIQKCRIRHDRILSIRRISDFKKSVGFRRIRIRIRNPSHPYYRLKIAIFEVAGSVCPKISGTRGRPPPTILRVSKLDEFSFHMV